MSATNDNLDYAETGAPDLDYHALNAKLNLVGTDGRLQLSADREAAKQFFLQHVNQNTVYFHDLEEKLEYLVDNGYYEEEVIEQYSFEFVKSLYKRAYAFKFRFQSFLGAFKYYSSYTLKTFDGKRYLERFEDRVTMVSLYLAQGNEATAEKILDEIMSGRFQPATPTFLNAGKAQRGELVSCFPAGSPVDTAEGLRPIESIEAGTRVLSHDGQFHTVTGTMVRQETEGLVTLTIAGSLPLTLTPEHPILVAGADTSIPELAGKDGSGDLLKWVAAKDVQVGQFVVAARLLASGGTTELALLDYLQDDSLEDVDGSILRRNRDKRLRGTPTGKYSKVHTPIRSTIPLDGDFGRFLGYYLAEGHIARTRRGETARNSGVVFTFGSHEDAFIQDVITLAKDLFGIEAKAHPGKGNWTNVAVNSTVLAEFILALVGTGFNAKTLPEVLRTAPDEFLSQMLVGAYRGDGCTTSSGITMSLVNPELVYQLRQVALGLDLLARTRVYDNSAGNLTANVDITGFPGNEFEFIHEVGKNIEGFRGANPLYSHISKWVAGQPVFRVEATNFEQVETDVYNLEVEDTHSYVVSGHVVHNCFLLRVEDNMESIARGINSSLQLSKRGGGVALNLTNIREAGAPIKHIENQSSGVIPVMKLLEDSFSYANQLGARQGAGAVYLNAHHPDIMRFLDTKRENADEKIRIKTLSLGVVIPDITFELAKNNEDMYLFSPYDVERVYGVPFSDISVTEKYHEMVNDGRIRKTKVKARHLFQTIAEIQFESGYPYILFEDTANRSNPIQGRITMSNLCSEILQVSEPSTYHENLNYDHIGKDISCNLGSLNIALAYESPDFANTVETAVRSLTAVSDLSNIAAVPSIESGNDRSHAIGLGQMNLHGFLAKKHIHYDSPEAVDFTNMYFYAVLYQALRASNRIAQERNEKFDGFENSKYATGEFFTKYIEKDWSKPETETVRSLLANSTIYIPKPADWAQLAEDVEKHGLYNQNLQAVPPTGSISYINNSTSSIHPVAAPIEIRKEGKIGRVYYPAPFLAEDTIPYYKDAFQIGPDAIIAVYAAATQHVDQGLSLTLFYPDTATTRDLNKSYIKAWTSGIKTLYYVRLKQKALDGTQLEGTAAEYCESCQL